MLGEARRRILGGGGPPRYRAFLEHRTVRNGPERRAAVYGVKQVPVGRTEDRRIAHRTVAPGDTEDQARTADALRRERNVEILAFVGLEVPPLLGEQDSAVRHQSLLLGRRAAHTRADDVVEVRSTGLRSAVFVDLARADLRNKVDLTVVPVPLYDGFHKRFVVQRNLLFGHGAQLVAAEVAETDGGDIVGDNDAPERTRTLCNDRVKLQIAARTVAAPRYGRIGQHEDGVAALVVAHQRSDIPARGCGCTDRVQCILERIAVGAVGVGAVLAHDLQAGHGNQRIDIGVGKFGNALGLNGNLEFVGSRGFQDVGCRKPRDGIAFGIGLLFEGSSGDCKPHLREARQRVVFGSRKLQAETILPVEALDIDRPVVLAAVEEELLGLGTRNDVLAGRIADDEPFDILRERDLARSQGTHACEVGNRGIGFLGNLA